MKQDIDHALEGWDHEPGSVQARLVEVRKGRHVIQMRVELGVLQMETDGRPDGVCPHGRQTYLEYLQHLARKGAKAGRDFVLSEEQCQEADREFVQFYHRRICWLALREYGRAQRDADHTLVFMDFVRRHSPSTEYTEAHEQYRGFVLFQRTQAAAALQVEEDRPEQAIDEIRAGLDLLCGFFAERDPEADTENDGMVQHLRRIESALREQYHIEVTLQEQLDQAVASEDYEKAAQLRDALKRRQ